MLGFHELRKFLELWLSSKEISHEFYLLNVMRHLKSDNPFERIVYKNKTTARGSSGSAKKRAYSAKHRATNEGFSQLTNDKLREKLGQQSDEKYQTHDGGFFASTKDEKYEHFKKGITD